MKFGLRARYLAISAAVAVTFLLALATPAAAGKAQLAGRTASSEAQSKTIDIVGADILAINQFVKSTFRFKPGTVRVEQGDTIILANQTTDAHSFSLVNGSLLPSTIGAVFGCGAPPPPANICFPVLNAHFPHGPPSGPPPSGPPPICQSTTPVTTFCVVPFVDGGLASPTPPGLDTAWTLTTGGDSVVIGPLGAPSITMTVTASPGTELHFMCVIHPWMQGELEVTR